MNGACEDMNFVHLT